MRKVLLLSALVACASVVASAQGRGGALSFGVTDARKVIVRDMGRGLLLRVVKESSASQRHFGWSVEVVRKPYRRTSRNLLFSRGETHGAHPSQVFAWHVSEREFPAERELDVRGYPVTVRIELLDPVVEGEGAERRFASGEIRITWGRRQRARRATLSPSVGGARPFEMNARQARPQLAPGAAQRQSSSSSACAQKLVPASDASAAVPASGVSAPRVFAPSGSPARGGGVNLTRRTRRRSTRSTVKAAPSYSTRSPGFITRPASAIRNPATVV